MAIYIFSSAYKAFTYNGIFGKASFLGNNYTVYGLYETRAFWSSIIFMLYRNLI